MEDMTLDSLAVGQRAAVAALSAPEEQRRRLLDLGFVPGGTVAAVQESPWGDPVAYAVCGAVIALRRADADGVALERRVQEVAAGAVAT